MRGSPGRPIKPLWCFLLGCHMQHLVISASFDSIRHACEFALQVARGAGIQDERILFHIELAVDEACTNVVEHAYSGGGQGRIHLYRGLGEYQGLSHFIIKLRDQGTPFDPASAPICDSQAYYQSLQVGGLGMLFMRKTMDHVEFACRDGWNELVMYKRLPQGDS
jgi:anti-sigma regulatory factor (Ser/Thr protein kinase)